MSITDIRIVEAGTYEPVSVEFFKQHARLGGDETEPDDTESLNLPAYIKAARIHAEKATGMVLTDGLYEVRLPSLCGPICLPVSPVSAIESITYLDTDGERQTLPAADYWLDDHPWEPRIFGAYGVAWPTYRVQPGGTRVQFRGVFNSDNPVESDLLIAICLMAAHWYENREEVVVGTIATKIPSAAEMLLQANRRTLGV